MEPMTPSAYLYADLKIFGGIKNQEAAQILLTDRPVANGESPRERARERTRLSREYVKSAPGDLPASFFADFAVSALRIANHMIAHLDTADAHERICRHYREDTVSGMVSALDAYGRRGQLYSNAVCHVATMPLANERSRCSVFILLFIVTGCLGDPAFAAAEAERFAESKLNGSFRTQTAQTIPSLTEPKAEPDGDNLLGLQRVVGGKLKPTVHPLDPAGTVVGALADGIADITDVDPDVSRRHLRIWRDGNRWLCEGLSSTNGTAIISGADKRVHVVEPPRSTRSVDWIAHPCEIAPADTLCLGATTRFMVIPIVK
ncbi:FHA domain-containing protein [Collinsella tanakaei]|nr:FHA domain-containing protein [Collinsella tanakaei]